MGDGSVAVCMRVFFFTLWNILIHIISLQFPIHSHFLPPRFYTETFLLDY